MCSVDVSIRDHRLCSQTKSLYSSSSTSKEYNFFFFCYTGVGSEKWVDNFLSTTWDRDKGTQGKINDNVRLFITLKQLNEGKKKKLKKKSINNNKQFHHVRCSIEYPALTFIRSARCSIIKNENGIKYENMKFWNGFFQHQPASNYYYYFTILNVRKELRSRILRFISIRFPFFCAAITSQTHSLTITIISYLFAGVYLVFWTRNGRVYRRVIMMNICALRSSAITK